MTRRLYDEDSHLRSFSAIVTDCAATGGAYAVTLDRTAFYPGGGGQDADGGCIAGIEVLGVGEAGDEVVHILPDPLKPGEKVECGIDWETRFRRMQNHSGEHIISGTVHRLLGINNVGFHMNERSIVLDFDSELSEDDILRIEKEANAAIYRNLAVTAETCTQAQLSGMEYRSKKNFDSDVRIVTIPGVDACACCAPHVKHTGEIGLIKILDFTRHRGGMRLTAVCGEDALDDYRQRFSSTVAVSRALSAKQEEIVEAVERTLLALYAAEGRVREASRRLARQVIAQLTDTAGNICLFTEELEPEFLRDIVNAGVKHCTGVCAVFCGADGAYSYIMGSESADLRAAAKEINAAISGKGGGSASMIQGTAGAGRTEIEAFFSGKAF